MVHNNNNKQPAYFRNTRAIMFVIHHPECSFSVRQPIITQTSFETLFMLDMHYPQFHTVHLGAVVEYSPKETEYLQLNFWIIRYSQCYGMRSEKFNTAK